MAMTAVTVTVDDAHMDKIEELAAQLRDSGMQVDQVLNEVGLISGSVPYGQQQMLQAVPGVQSVEGTQSYQLPPPESSIQ